MAHCIAQFFIICKNYMAIDIIMITLIYLILVCLIPNGSASRTQVL